jgi:hypothetical protein
MRGRTILAASALAAAITGSATSAAPAAVEGGFITEQRRCSPRSSRGTRVAPLLTVGDQLESGYRFESIPDGIAVRNRPRGRTQLFVNHETGKAPFPYVPAAPTEANGENDFDNSQLSRLTLEPEHGGSAQRLLRHPEELRLSALLLELPGDRARGLRPPIPFTNEESPDYVLRQEDSWLPPMGSLSARPASSSLSTSRRRSHRPIYGMGRHNHENSVAIPGYGRPVVLSGDDTYTSGPLTGPSPVPAQSQLYSYIAPGTKALLADKGNLWAFVSDTPGVESYYDVEPGSGTEVKGHFIKVPKDIATGRKADGSELKAADKGYPPPPADGS